MKKSLYACLLAGTALVMAPPVLAQDILNDPEPRQLLDQNIDPNRAFVVELRKYAEGGPKFKFSQDKIDLDLFTGERARATIRITNTGKKDGQVSDITLKGGFPGLEVDNTCEAVLVPRDYCEISVSYEGATPLDIATVLMGTHDDEAGKGERETFEIPVSISVANPPAPVEPAVKIEPVVVAPKVMDPEERNRQIARRYLGGLRPISTGRPAQKGFTIVSAEKDPQITSQVAGVSYQDMRVNTVSTDERYDREIPYTTASLPVDRDKILTSDRVIKAVLETPVSNVMCNKVVAMVESDVYSATGTRPLIQAGSRVIGECQQFVDERVGVAWSRIITTDGRSISFQERMADTSDATGLGGAVGRIYMSPFDRYVLPIVSTMIDTTAGVVFAAFGDDEDVVVDSNGNTTSETSARNEGLRIVTGEARETAQQIIRDIRDTREIAVIPKGSRIDIDILEDIYFRDDRKVVSLADMSFDLDEIEVGTADRDLPANLTLVPVSADYSGASVVVNGRRYRLEDGTSGSASEGSSRVIPEISRETLNDLEAGSGNAG